MTRQEQEWVDGILEERAKRERAEKAAEIIRLVRMRPTQAESKALENLLNQNWFMGINPRF